MFMGHRREGIPRQIYVCLILGYAAVLSVWLTLFSDFGHSLPLWRDIGLRPPHLAGWLWKLVAIVIVLVGWLHHWFKEHSVGMWTWFFTAIGFRHPDQIAHRKTLPPKDALFTVMDEWAKNPEKRSLLVTGAWGCGKTYRVREFLASHPIQGCYVTSYVSLFGLSTTEQVINEVLAQVDVEARFLARCFFGLMRLTFPFLKLWAKIASHETVTDFLVRRLIRNVAIVLDDLERRDPVLQLDRVLGVLNKFNSEAGCRSIVIWNDDKPLPGDEMMMREYQDKMVDTRVRHIPKAADCISIAFKTGCPPILEKVFLGFNLTNIRILRLAGAAVKRWDEVSVGYSESTKETLRAHVACMTVVYHLDPKIDLATLKDFNFWADRGKLADRNWGVALMAADFSSKAYDAVIADYLHTGIVDEDLLKDILKTYAREDHDLEITYALRRAWNIMLSNLQADDAEIRAAFDAVKAKYFDSMNAGNIHSLVEGYQALGDVVPEAEWYETWFRRVTKDRTPKELAFMVRRGNELIPTGFHSRFRELIILGQSKRPFSDVFRDFIHREATLSDIDVIILSGVTQEDYFKWLMESKDEDLRTVARLTRAKLKENPDWKTISDRIDAAFEQAAATSPRNKWRIDKWKKDPV